MSDDEFSTQAAVEIVLDERSLRQAREQLNSELGQVQTGVTDGGTPSAQAGRAMSSRQVRRERRTFRLDRERNDLLTTAVNLLDEIEEQGLGGGGGGGGGGGLGGIPGTLGLGALAAKGIGGLSGSLGVGTLAATVAGTATGATALGVGAGSVAGAALEQPARRRGRRFARNNPESADRLETVGLASGIPIFGSAAIDLGEFLSREDRSLTFDDTQEATGRTIADLGLDEGFAPDTGDEPLNRGVGSGRDVDSDIGMDVNTVVTDPESADLNPAGTTSVNEALEGVGTPNVNIDITPGLLTGENADTIREAAASRRSQRRAAEDAAEQPPITTNQQTPFFRPDGSGRGSTATQGTVERTTEVDQTTIVENTIMADLSSIISEIDQRIDEARKESMRELRRELDRREREIRRDVSGN